MSIYTERMNPAFSLYRFWLDVLEALAPIESERRSVCSLGRTPGWGISSIHKDHQGRPVLEFGKLESYGGFTPHFYLSADGRFRFNYKMWGCYRRNAIAENTFLGWYWSSSRYQWFYETTKRDRWSNGHSMLDDWRKPVAYYGEYEVGCSSWRGFTWMVLVRDPADGWRLAPARNQVDPWGDPLASTREVRRIMSENVARRWKRYDALRERRYRLAEDADLKRKGLAPRRRAATLQVGAEALTDEEAVLHLVALLEVSAPARSTPLLPRPKEAPHGTNNMAAANQL